MSLRIDHLLASAALVAVSLAAALGAAAQEAAPTPAEVPAKSSDEVPAASAPSPGGAATAVRAPASGAESAPVLDPLASLDPADRAIAERIRDLLATKPNRIFADEKELAAV